MKTDTIDTRPAAATKADDAWHSIAFNVQFEGLLMFPGPSLALAAFLKADMERALSEHGVLLPRFPDPSNNGKVKNASMVIGQLNWFSGVFFVTDWQKGLVVLEEELKRTGLFTHCETGWHCPSELIWRRHHPKTQSDIFLPLLFTWKRVSLPANPEELLKNLVQCFSTSIAKAATPPQAPPP